VPAAKSAGSSEPFRTFDEFTEFGPRSAALTWPFLICFDLTLFFGSVAAYAPPPSAMNKASVAMTFE
jgi:hypothetical protein